MRLWSLHPRYLDQQGLLALWREALLARAVLAGRTRGYRHHPQLERFRRCPDPLAALDAYLLHVRQEGLRRGYRFCAHDPAPGAFGLTVTTGQLAYELEHLRRKLAVRAPDWARCLPQGLPEPHPLFRVVEGDVEPWERP
ncbi:MAG TPA: pyrimidine dimer DNA glycosylase/endonuclease V [Dehalococcoidia bacterium]|nr:pyrimidine dimer DNA glycosylase/endonuclease V [Dehalococcoidia bacterium]